MKRTVAILVMLGLMSSTACTSTGTGGSAGTAGNGNGAVALADVPRATPGVEQAASAAQAVNRFGIALYHRVVTDGGAANVVFSPASIALAMAMTRPGARGTTAEELDAVFDGLAGARGLDPLNALDRALAARTGTFNTNDGPQDVKLTIANAPFGQKGFSFVQAYLDALASGFGAGLRLVDYKGDTEGARKTINAWVSDQTAKRIPELLGQEILTGDSRLTLVNAIYMKASWAHRFADKEMTKDEMFTRVDASTVAVPMMFGGGHLPYAAGDGWQAVELPYAGEQLSMLVILPTRFASFETAFDPSTLATVIGGLGERLVNLRMPRFSIESKTDLASMLQTMGITAAFSAKTADFSGITAEEKLFISAVIHQANIDVDENGTEAAAATAVVMAAGSAAPKPEEPVSMTVDHPFLFAIRDRETGAILFMGRVTDPSIGK